MEFIKAKTILTKVKYGNEWYGIDYNMNLYRGCCHGCIYCDSRSDCYHIDNFDIPKGKENDFCPRFVHVTYKISNIYNIDNTNNIMY